MVIYFVFGAYRLIVCHFDLELEITIVRHNRLTGGITRSATFAMKTRRYCNSPRHQSTWFLMPSSKVTDVANPKPSKSETSARQLSGTP